ncbi:MAG: SUMF1/EgtB/PvdO family nonheme iron enzyme [Clostridia bacterium]|nr:SUMF1/EgtB/PvdO family nonheme iron enzyme [Clostridia bacterium]
MSNFDLSNLALKAIAPNNEILYDDQGKPSIMVRIPQMTYAQLGLGDSTDVFPAFIVDGNPVSDIYISKYQNVVSNSRAYSLPGRAPTTNITFDTAISRCKAKGRGWHLMTAMEWGMLILWCEKNGFIPLGNVAYGKYHTETNYKAIPATGHTAEHWAEKVLTGTGPLTWYHDGTPGGIADLCGNVWEWTGGVRTVYGELQVLANNDSADSDNAQTAAATGWKAIDATSGTLITPNGEGTTPGSIKMDYVGSAIKYDTTISSQSDSSRYCNFNVITYNSETISAAAVKFLQAIGFLPITGTLCTTYGRCYFNNGAAERSFFRGGLYSSSHGSSFPSFGGGSDRSFSGGGIGFRSAFVKLPAA